MGIIADSQLPWFLKPGMTFSRMGQYSVNEDTVLWAVFPTGASYTVQPKHIKRRYVEQYGKLYVERYFLQTDPGDTRHLKTIMVRIYDTDKVYTLINAPGIGAVVHQFSPDMDDLQRDTPDSYFIADIELQAAAEMEEELLPDAVNDFIATLMHSRDGLSVWYRPIVESTLSTNSIRSTLADTLMMTERNQLNKSLFVSSLLDQYLAVDTGNFPQVDVVTSITAEGDADTTFFDRLKRPSSPVLSGTVLPKMYPSQKTIIQPLSEAQLSVIFTLPMTDWHYEYISPVQTPSQWMPKLCVGYNRYTGDTTPHGILHFAQYEIPQGVRKMVVHRSWEDDHLWIQYFQKETDTRAWMTVCTDLVMEAITSPNLVHL